MTRRIITRLFFILVFLAAPIGWAARMESLAVHDQNDATSIIFMFDGAFRHHVFMLSNPSRIVVDFDKVTSAVDIKRVDLTKRLITQVRSGHPTEQTLRLVFDVTEQVKLKATTWPSVHAKRNGLRIDIFSQRGLASSQALKAGGTHHLEQRVLPNQVVKTKNKHVPVHVQHAPSKILRDVIVVLDPGHGGKDPGAIGPRHVAEKNVVLAIALKLKQLIDKQPGMRAVLTRKGDYYVGLRERLNIARRQNADIFISIHADAFINHHSNGASVFALSQTGATSEAARWLAEKENYSELGGVNLSNLDDQNGLIRTVLLDLSQTATITASLQMGTQVLHHLDRVTALHNSAVEQARFVVLKSPDIPSVLIETGFITNPREENNLSSPSYQAKLTQAIFEGVKKYFSDSPPHGTKLEALSGGNQHIVKLGETLPAIAARYHVSVRELKSVNRLSNQQLAIGQKLSIPKTVS